MTEGEPPPADARGPGGPGAVALRALPSVEIEDALKRATLYAAAKLRRPTHAEPALDPANLALAALEDTLAGRRRWRPDSRSLLRHLAMTIDSRMSHFFASPRFTRLRAADADDAREAALPARAAAPEDEVAVDQAVAALERFVAGRSPALSPLLRLVTREGLALSETDEVMRALGQDPGMDADRQRVYRQIRALRAVTAEWRTGSAEEGEA